MLFSIIIPLYNNEKYIEECMESIIYQSEQSFELIVINDGSTDRSQEIVEKYLPEHHNIKLINQKNKGLLHTRCVGINYSSAKYIIFVDSDDKLEPNALDILKKNLSDEDIDVLIYQMDRMDDSGNRRKLKKPFPKNTIFEKENKKQLYELILNTSQLNSMSAKVVKKECFDCEEILNYPDIKNGEDLLHTLPVITNAKKVKYIDEILYSYRMNQHSMTRTFDAANFFGAGIRYKALKSYLHKWNMYSPRYASLLDQRYLKDIAKITAYHKSSLKNSKKNYFKMLQKINNDASFKKIYTSSFKEISLVYKIPNWLIFYNHFNLLYYFKLLVFIVRR